VSYEDQSSGLVSSDVGLRLSTSSVRRRFCCRLPSVSQRLLAVFEPQNNIPAPLIQVKSQLTTTTTIIIIIIIIVLVVVVITVVVVLVVKDILASCLSYSGHPCGTGQNSPYPL